MRTIEQHQDEQKKAYAIAYQTDAGPMGSHPRLLTPSFTSVELALGYLYNMVDEWHWAVVKTVEPTSQTRSYY